MRLTIKDSSPWRSFFVLLISLFWGGVGIRIFIIMYIEFPTTSSVFFSSFMMFLICTKIFHSLRISVWFRNIFYGTTASELYGRYCVLSFKGWVAILSSPSKGESYILLKYYYYVIPLFHLLLLRLDSYQFWHIMMHFSTTYSAQTQWLWHDL